MKNTNRGAALKSIRILGLTTCLTFFGTAQSAVSQFETSKKSRGPKTCVLHFERKEQPFLNHLKAQYKKRPEVILVSGAKPADLVRCVLAHNPKEVLILAHAYKVSSDKTRIGFFSEKSDAEARKLYKKDFAKVKRQHQAVMSREGYSMCDNKRKLRYPCNSLQRQELNLRNKLTKLASLKPTDSEYKYKYGYNKEFVYEKSFEDLLSIVKTSNLNLRKIKLSSGGKTKVLNAYPGLKKMVREQGVRLVTSPKNQMNSFADNSPFTRTVNSN